MQRRRIETDGRTQSILTAGEGPLVLLVHGFPELAISWRAQIEALATAGYRVVAPDMRGYGQTGGPDRTGPRNSPSSIWWATWSIWCAPWTRRPVWSWAMTGARRSPGTAP